MSNRQVTTENMDNSQKPINPLPSRADMSALDRSEDGRRKTEDIGCSAPKTEDGRQKTEDIGCSARKTEGSLVLASLNRAARSSDRSSPSAAKG